MRELSIDQTEMVNGGCSSTELFYYAAQAADYGYKFLTYGGAYNEFMYNYYTAKTFSCI
jgi:hypothetical protein